MNKQFVNYEIAKKLQELGFKNECLATIDQTEFLHIRGTPYGIRGAMCYDTIPCPLWQQVQEWLREKHDVHIVIDPAKEKGKLTYYGSVVSDLVNEEVYCIEGFDTYEECLEDALLDGLNLIENEID